MKNKIFSLFTIVALLFAFSCKKMENSERWQNLPEIKMLDAASATGNIILLQGECLINGGGYNSGNCSYFFLYSSDGKTFSESEIEAEYDWQRKRYTGVYTPSADGTYYFKFCAVSKDRYSYIESEVKAAEYKEVVPPVPEAIDLGLPSGLKWADFNLGASKPEGYGGYYQWACTQDVTNTNIKLEMYNYPYCYYGSGSWVYTKYNSSDKKTVLEPGDDVAHVKLGGNWRMPTEEEWQELEDNCTFTKTTQNGVSGYNVTSKIKGYTDKSIFFPLCGRRSGKSRIDAGKYGEYWSSSLNTHFKDWDIGSAAYFKSSFDISFGLRYEGLSVRPVYTGIVSVPVTGVTVTPESAEIEAGKTLQLTATVLPENASDKSVTWSSSNTKVATVSAEGLVTAVSEGSAVITATTTDGGKTHCCKLMVTPAQEVSGAVDLGLSVKWATCNVGASKPEEYGGYYQWAGTEDVTSTSINLDWDNCPYHTGTSSGSGWTKYSYSDKKEVLDPEDDVAHVKLGGDWRMPTDTEWKALIDNCTWTWTVQNKVHGYKVASNIKGYTDKSIFLPACGYRNGTSLLYNDLKGDDESKIAGRYWSSTRSKEMYGRSMEFNSTSFGQNDRNRYFGYSIRPVSE